MSREGRFFRNAAQCISGGIFYAEEGTAQDMVEERGGIYGHGIIPLLIVIDG